MICDLKIMMFFQFLATNQILKLKLKNSHQMISKDIESSCVCQKEQYNFAFSKKGSMGRSPMHRLWDTLKVLPIFALLRADRSVYRSAASYVSNSKLRFALSFHPLFVGGIPLLLRPCGV